MKRSDSSAPSWNLDAVEVLQRMRFVLQRATAELHQPSEVQTSAKPIALGERRTTTENSGNLTISAAIDQQLRPLAKCTQHTPRVQSREITQDEADFLEVLDSLGGHASGRTVSEELGCSVRAVRTLAHRLWKLGCVEIVAGRGIRRVG